MVDIFISVSGLDEMINSFQNIKHVSVLTKKELGIVLEGVVFKKTQENVHVISGRLKASGRTKKDSVGDQWSGEIIYGGHDYVPPGYTSSAYYADYENTREGSKPGHGPHDFFFGLEIFDSAFEDAINTQFDYAFKKTK